MRIYILQAINNQVIHHEFESIIEKTRAHRDHFVQVDLFHEDQRSSVFEEIPDMADGIIVAGAPYSIAHLEELHMVDPVVSLLRALVERKTPTLGICYGHQLLSHALGGTVVHDPNRAEKGFTRIYKHELAKDDPLFAHLPDSFISRAHHSDHVHELPEGALHLLYNSRSPIQGFRLKDAYVYGVQFHPEISHQDVLYRWENFRDTYFSSEEDFEGMKNNVIPADEEAHTILERFVALVQEQKKAV